MTPTEASVLAVLYAAIVGLFVYREVKWRDLPELVVKSAMVTGAVGLLLGTAGLVSWFLTVQQLPDKLIRIMTVVPGSSLVFLVATALIFIFFGAVIEGLPAVVILLPSLLPVAKGLGIDPIHYAIVIVAAVGIGLFLPPIGVGLFIACGIADVTVDRATRAMMPFVAVLAWGSSSSSWCRGSPSSCRACSSCYEVGTHGHGDRLPRRRRGQPRDRRRRAAAARRHDVREEALPRDARGRAAALAPVRAARQADALRESRDAAHPARLRRRHDHHGVDRLSADVRLEHDLHRHRPARDRHAADARAGDVADARHAGRARAGRGALPRRQGASACSSPTCRASPRISTRWSRSRASGSIRVDVAYGGAFFAIVDAPSLGFAVEPKEARDLVAVGNRITAAAAAQLPVAPSRESATSTA